MPAVSWSVKRTTTSLPPDAPWHVRMLSASANWVSKCADFAGPFTTSEPRFTSGLHSTLMQLGAFAHEASAQSMSPLLLSSMPLLQISADAGVDSVIVTGPCPAGENGCAMT